MTDWFDQAKQEIAEGDEYADADVFNFETEGDTFTGIFLQAESVNTKYGSRFLLIVKPVGMDPLPDTPIKIWAGGVLQSQLLEALPSQGSPIVIQYHGEVQSKRNPGMTYKSFSMKARESDVDYWRQLSAKAALTPAPSAPRAESVFDEAPF